MFRLIVAVFLIISLSSCSALFGHNGYFRDRGDDYKKATEIPPMKVPGNLNSSAISELFVIPPVSNEYVDTDNEFEAPRPNFISSTEQAQIKIQKLNSRRWIAINASTSEVWPRVQRFLDENKIPVASTKTNTGEIETEWLKLQDEPANRDRYKISIEQGIMAHSCEIHITQVTQPSNIPANPNVNWPAASNNPDREKWMLDKLANYLATDDKSGASLLAQSAVGSRKVEFIQPYQADPYLVFSLDTERAGASLAGALNRHPFAIVDMDQDKGIYHFSYDPLPLDNEKPGFFCRLTGCEARAMKKRAKNLQYYRLQLLTGDVNEIKVFIQNESGEALPYKEAQKLLSLVRNLLV